MTCYEICRKEERRLKRISDERKRVRKLRKEEREELRRKKEREEAERKELENRAERISALFKTLKSICGKYGAYEVIVPKSEQEMVREGKRMHNCVGHCYPMRQGVDSIVVFFHKNGKACVDVDIDPRTFKVVQCRAVCNKEADKSAHELAKRIAARIENIYRKAA